MGLLRHLACLATGVVVGFASLSAHRSVFPVGLLLVVSSTLGVAWWLLRSSYPRTAVSYAAGWLVMFALALVGRPEGDFVVAGDLEGYSLMGTGLVLMLVAIVSFAAGRRH